MEALESLGFDPHIATERQRHHVPQAQASETPATAKERMAAKVRTPEGKALYSRRKVIVEPVFGQIKEARGFRRFLLRGLEKIVWQCSAGEMEDHRSSPPSQKEII